MKVKVSWGLELILSGFHQCNNKFHLNRPSYSWFIRTWRPLLWSKLHPHWFQFVIQVLLFSFSYWVLLPSFSCPCDTDSRHPYQILSLGKSTLLGRWVKTWFGSFGALQSGSTKLGSRVINHPSLPGTSLVSVMKVMYLRKPLHDMRIPSFLS